MIALTSAPDGGTALMGAVAIIGVVVLAFIVFRAVALWYWKIEDILTKLDRIGNLLERIAAKPEQPK